MDFKSTRYLCALADLKSISAAAKYVGVTQPTMSKFLIQYEQELGFYLFHKIGKKVFVTEEGKEYIQKCKEILELSKQLDNLKEKFSNYDGTLTIGVTPARGAYILPNILPEFRARFPYCEIKIREGTVRDVENYIREGQVNIGIFLLESREYPDLIIEELGMEEILLCAKEGSLCEDIAVWKPGFDHPWVDLSALKKEFFILPAKSMRLYPLVDECFGEYGYYPKHIRTSNVDGNINLASQGFGFCFAPELSVNFCRTLNKVSYFSVGKKRRAMRFVIAYHKNAYLSPSCKELISIVKSLFRLVQSE